MHWWQWCKWRKWRKTKCCKWRKWCQRRFIVQFRHWRHSILSQFKLTPVLLWQWHHFCHLHYCRPGTIVAICTVVFAANCTIVTNGPLTDRNLRRWITAVMFPLQAPMVVVPLDFICDSDRNISITNEWRAIVVNGDTDRLPEFHTILTLIPILLLIPCVCTASSVPPNKSTCFSFYTIS